MTIRIAKESAAATLRVARTDAQDTFIKFKVINIVYVQYEKYITSAVSVISSPCTLHIFIIHNTIATTSWEELKV